MADEASKLVALELTDVSTSVIGRWRIFSSWHFPPNFLSISLLPLYHNSLFGNSCIMTEALADGRLRSSCFAAQRGNDSLQESVCFCDGEGRESGGTEVVSTCSS